MAAAGARCLLVCAEESVEQVRLRAERLGALAPELLIVAETSLPRRARRTSPSVAPDVVAVDSIQTVADPDVPGRARFGHARCASARTGSCASPRTAASPTVLVGHVTKDGAIAGPARRSSTSSTPCSSFEGDRHHALRMLRALKHRFGADRRARPVRDDGATGCAAVADPCALFLADRRAGAPGSVVAAVLEGARPLLVEVQALVTADARADAAPLGAGPRRRPAALLLAVLERARRAAGRAAPTSTRASPAASASPSRRRPRGRDRGRRARAPDAGRRPTWSRSARSGSAARCARSPQIAAAPRGGGAARLPHAIVPASTADVAGIDAAPASAPCTRRCALPGSARRGDAAARRDARPIGAVALLS